MPVQSERAAARTPAHRSTERFALAAAAVFGVIATIDHRHTDDGHPPA